MHLPLDAGMAEQGGHLGGHGHVVSDVVGKVNMRALECTTFRIATLKTTLLHVLKECKQVLVLMPSNKLPVASSPSSADSEARIWVGSYQLYPNITW
jgi:hypothetical protein